METKLLKGKPVAEHIYNDLQKDITILKQNNIRPALRVLLIGNNPASIVYTQKKTEKCVELGIDGKIIRLKDQITTKELLDTIQSLNDDEHIHGILVQLPLPPHIEEQTILEAVSPYKDVDGFHPMNVGKLHLEKESALIPCTAIGIIRMLEYYNVKIKSSHAVVLGRSNIVGKPIAALLSSKKSYGNATLTICHSKTKDIEQITKCADIIISAMGIPLFLKKHMVKEGACIIDVGINRVPKSSQYHGKKTLVGDVDFDDLIGTVGSISPVPGGVGPLTVAMLISNLITATYLQLNIQK